MTLWELRFGLVFFLSFILVSLHLLLLVSHSHRDLKRCYMKHASIFCCHLCFFELTLKTSAQAYIIEKWLLNIDWQSCIVNPVSLRHDTNKFSLIYLLICKIVLIYTISLVQTSRSIFALSFQGWTVNWPHYVIDRTCDTSRHLRTSVVKETLDLRV